MSQTQKLTIRFLIFGFLFLLPLTVFSATQGAGKTYDTIAGFETVVKLPKSPNNILLRLISPSGERNLLGQAVLQNGEARFEISGEKLRKAGEYQVEFIARHPDRVLGKNIFFVYPDSPHPDFSGMYPLHDRGVTGGNPIRVNTRLQDQYGNGIEGHEILLTSSRPSDVIERNAELSDANGNVLFFIRAFEPGMVLLTASDQTEKMNFSRRVSLSFEKKSLGARSLASAFGGDTESRLLSLNDTVSGIHHFEILDVTETVQANDNISFRVKAVDSAENIITTYVGTVKFTSSDTNATLPSEYTFQPSDLGEHRFDLSLSFRETGEQTVTVEEKEHDNIKGEITVNVQPARSSASTASVAITKPTVGSYGAASLEIEGNAPPNANVTLYDNGQQIGVTRASSVGLFTWSVSGLSDGLHTFTAEANGILSSEVQITISASGATVERITLTPNPIGPGETVEVTVRSTPDLDSVSLLYGDESVALQPHLTDRGTYQGSITAPTASGSYPITVQLVDQFGNETSQVEAETLVVDENLGRNLPAFRVPSRVRGVRTAPGPGRVTLSWEPSTDDTGIAFYKIYYGLDRNHLDQVVATPDARTIWYVPNLESGVEYFFEVVGVDTEGNEGHQRSAVVGSLVNGGGGGRVGSLPDGDMLGPPSSLPEDGPPLWTALGASLMAGIFQRWRARRRS